MTKFNVVTFGTAEFSWAIEVQKRRSLQFGAHRHIAYGIESAPVVNARFENASLSLEPRGYGLWIWKPYILLDAISQCDADDYVIYLDAGIAPIDDMGPWFDQLRRRAINFFAPVPPRPLRQWTKRDCFVYMKADAPEFHDASILSAGIQAYRNVPESSAFLAELKSLMRNPLLLADAPTSRDAGEDESFIAHRHDQSILTLLSALRGCTVYREPSQYGIWTPETRQAYAASGAPNPGLLNEDCGQILDVHRGRNRSHSLLLQLWRIRRKIAGARRGVVCV
jgi:hypothetical protein